METSEMPSGPEPKTPEGLEKKPELPEAAAEAPEDAPEVDSAVEDAGKEFEAAGAELTTFGSAELARVTAEATPDELDDPELAAARQEIDDVAAQGKAATEKHKGRLASIGSKLKRWGRAALAGAVISGSAMPAGEAMAAGPDRGPKVEHVEKGKQAPRWTEVVAATENDAMNDADLLAERGEAGRKEFVEATKSFDQELARKDAAELAGLDVAKLGKDGFKKVEIWSEKTFRDRQNREFPPLPDSMDAQADNDEIRLRPSRFLEADGSVDAGKVKKGLTHEFLHVVATTENADGQQERLWDKAGVSHELNEGVTELYALRIAQKEGVKIENHQAYAGGNLVAARLIEGVVGQKALYADYVEGKTDRLKAGLDAKFGKGSADKILAKRMEVGEEGDALAIVMELARSGADVEKLWSEAKAEGFLDDVRISPDGKAVTLSRDIEGKGVLVNTLVDEGEPVSKDMPVMRVFASTLKEGKAYDAANVQKAAEGVQHLTEVNDRTRNDLKAQLDGLADDYRKAQAAGDTEKLKTLDPPDAMPGLYETILPDQLIQAKQGAVVRGENVTDPNVFFNTRGSVDALQKAYENAATPDAKAAARAAIESANESAARDAAKRIRLENLTPPIPGSGSAK